MRDRRSSIFTRLDTGLSSVQSTSLAAPMSGEAPPPEPTRVLMLNDPDGTQSDYIRDQLIAAGFDVTESTPFWEWDGSGLDEVDVVFYFNPANYFGYGLGDPDYGHLLSPEGFAALEPWLLGGGTIVRVEWTLYGLQGLPGMDIDQYMPAIYDVDETYEYDATVNVTDAGHPLTQGVAASFGVGGAGCSAVILESGAVSVAEVVWDGHPPSPFCSYKAFGSGRVIHISSDFGNDGDVQPDANSMRILANALNYFV